MLELGGALIMGAAFLLRVIAPICRRRHTPTRRGHGGRASWWVEVSIALGTTGMLGAGAVCLIAGAVAIARGESSPLHLVLVTVLLAGLMAAWRRLKVGASAWVSPIHDAP